MAYQIELFVQLCSSWQYFKWQRVAQYLYGGGVSC